MAAILWWSQTHLYKMVMVTSIGFWHQLVSRENLGNIFWSNTMTRKCLNNHNFKVTNLCIDVILIVIVIQFKHLTNTWLLEDIIGFGAWILLVLSRLWMMEELESAFCKLNTRVTNSALSHTRSHLYQG